MSEPHAEQQPGPGGPVIWLATQNPKKAAELARILPATCHVRSLDELPGAEDFDVVEDAPDFAGNARKKARAAAAWLRARLPGTASRDLVVADDSGLVVDALGGAPGVHSARWAGPDASDQDRIRKLLAALEAVPEPWKARFVCCLIAIDLEGTELFAHEGRCEGTIARSARGTQGFGYDPVFLPEAEGGARSFAELGAAEKDAISHRGRALAAFRAYLQSPRRER